MIMHPTCVYESQAIPFLSFSSIICVALHRTKISISYLPSERNFFVFLFCQFPISYDFNFIRLSCFSVGLVLLLLMKASYVYKFAIKWKERNYYFGPSTWEFAKKSGYFCEQMKWIHIFFSILFRCVQCLNGSNAGWCSPHSIKLQSNLIRCCSL